jgi:hypothetical protein
MLSKEKWLSWKKSIVRTSLNLHAFFFPAVLKLTCVLRLDRAVLLPDLARDPGAVWVIRESFF